MTARRSALRNRVEDLLIGALTWTTDRLPARLLLGLVRGVAWLGWPFLGGRRDRALNLVERTLRLPAKGPAARAVVRGTYRTFLLNLVETGIVVRSLRRGVPINRFVGTEGEEHMRAALSAGRGVLVCTGHLGAWELLPLVHAQLFGPAWIVARSPDNPLLERRLLARRQPFIRGAINKEGGGLKLARVLRRGEVAGMLLDQNAGQGGVTLDFLGLPSSHHNVAGIMARRLGAVVLPVYLLREPLPLRFRLVIEPPVTPDSSLSPEQAALDVTQRVSRSLAARVRAQPGQWLWLHDRWRHAERVERRERRQAPSRGRESPGAAGDTKLRAAQGTNGR